MNTTRFWIAGLACMAQTGFLFGQDVSVGSVTASPIQASSSPLSVTFEAQEQTLDQSLDAVIAEGATLSEINAWQLQYATPLQAQAQLATTLSAQSTLQPMPSILEVEIPATASPTLTDFLETQANLMNDEAQIHNQWIGTVSASTALTTAGQVQINQLEQSELQQFQQQDAAQLQAQQQRAQTLADEAAQQPLPVPPPLIIPAGASPNLQALLTLGDQLQRAQVTLWNQNLGGTAATQGAALLQWQQQNTASLQQMQQLAQAVAAESTFTATIITGPVTTTPLQLASPTEIPATPTSEN